MEWDLQPGDRIRRTALHDRYGGSRQGGISPSRRSPNIFIFTDPGTGLQHGYRDRWQEGVLYYAGEGQTGSQQMAHGNLQVLNHQQDDRALRVFEGARGEVTYIGRFELGDPPYKHVKAPESGNPSRMRRVIMFELQPQGDPAAITTPRAEQLAGHRPVSTETALGHLAVANLAGDGSAVGQGFRSDAKTRRVLELHAMHAADQHYTALGWTLEDVSATHPYDYRATKDGSEKHLEVKGTSGAGQEVLLTPNEVTHARSFPDVALIVCHSIEITRNPDEPKASGGQLEIYDPWTIDEGHLAPVGYAYSVPGEPD